MAARALASRWPSAWRSCCTVTFGSCRPTRVRRSRWKYPLDDTMSSSQLTLQEVTTKLSADEVMAQAKEFFATRPSLYSTFLDKEGPGFASFRGQGGEEIVIAVSSAPDGNGTRVTGSSYLFDMQVARFFTTIEPAGAP